MPTPLHLRCGCNRLQAISGFVYFSYFCCQRTTLVGFRSGVCQIDRREFRLQISAVQLACKVKTCIKNIYSKTQMNPLKNHSSSWRGTSEPRRSHVGATCWWGWTLWQRFDCTTQSRPSEMLRGSETPALILNERKMYVPKIALDILKRCNHSSPVSLINQSGMYIWIFIFVVQSRQKKKTSCPGIQHLTTVTHTRKYKYF